ncbi:MAG: prephenate dehydrogenase/arogenate dehydrogenase family protein, partial [Campylobacteraceae bacterium]|nr:prephenate dehydrogenase/arogenate dehydrogenase family protein [Campylobacteraceae bacterium]
FKGMSRIAKSSPQMWSEIFKQNSKNLLESISFFEKELASAKAMIESEEWESLSSWMGNATTLHKIL